MNNLDYLEYEGSRLLDYAMKTYSKTSTGSLVNDIERAVLAGQKELSLAEQDALQSLSFEYTLYRLYIARCMIRHHKSGFGCTDAILKGLSSTLSSLPSALKMLALEHDLNGSYLLLGCYVEKLTKAHVETMFQCYAAIEKACVTGGSRSAPHLFHRKLSFGDGQGDQLRPKSFPAPSSQGRDPGFHARALSPSI